MSLNFVRYPKVQDPLVPNGEFDNIEFDNKMLLVAVQFVDKLVDW